MVSKLFIVLVPAKDIKMKKKVGGSHKSGWALKTLDRSPQMRHIIDLNLQAY